MAAIRALSDDDAEAYLELRREALLDAPRAFGSSPGDDFVSSAEGLLQRLARAPDWIIFGAFDDALVGTVGLFRDRLLKASHKANIWGMYVRPGHRGKGVAGALLGAALNHARSLPGISSVRLIVSSAAPTARRLYERAGFQVWGTEPDALCVDGVMVAEHHMALKLNVTGLT